MEFLESLVIPRSLEHLFLLRFLLVLLLSVHLPFIGLVTGGAFFSVIFNILSRTHWRTDRNKLYSQFSKDLINTLAVSRKAGFLLGILPLLVITLISLQILVSLSGTTIAFLSCSSILITVSILLVYLYREALYSETIPSAAHLCAGFLGALGILGFYFLFISAFTSFINPEKLNFIKNPLDLILSWNVVARYLVFLSGSLAITGSGILFFFFSRPGRIQLQDAEYRNFAKQFGGGVGLASTVVLALFLLWYFMSMPDVALSAGVFAWALVALLLLMAISLMFYTILRGSAAKLGNYVFILFLGAFFVCVEIDGIARDNAVQEHILILNDRAETMKNERLARRKEAGGETAKISGKSVYKKHCFLCHRFDKKLVGPAFNDTLPHYKNNLESLKGFIKNPVKKNPQLPKMPKLDLQEGEIEAVALYLLETFEAKDPAPLP